MAEDAELDELLRLRDEADDDRLDDDRLVEDPLDERLLDELDRFEPPPDLPVLRRSAILAPPRVPRFVVGLFP